jgi:two-component system cell cycle sensor histidine kinase/response regulator CckA
MTSSPRRDSMKASILVVEDNLIILEATSRMLSKHDFCVLTASTGQMAIEVLRGHQAPVDLLVTDLLLDDMSGVDLLAALRESQPGLQAVFFTGADRDEVQKLLPPAEKFRLLTKPVSSNQLLESVQQALVGK